MSSPSKETEEVSTSDAASNGAQGAVKASVEPPRPPAKRPAPAVIEISDTDSDDSDVCAVTSYQATADEVKRIRGAEAEYSSSSSSSSYSSDSDSGCEDDSMVVAFPARGPHARAQLNPRANRTEDPIFNPKYKAAEVIEKLTESWKERRDCSTGELTLTCSPFRVCLLHETLANPEIINNIIDDMNTLDWTRKKMDLYEFHQTADLASLTWQRGIRGIYELLKTDVMTWVSSVTGLTLTHVSASCSLYGPGDHLLVHDDLLADRRVAFILYLAPWVPRPPRSGHHNGAKGGPSDTIVVGENTGWAEHMGGALELLGRDEGGRPKDVERRVLPSNNTMAFFRVGPDSFHQVGEVLSLELPRLSINGWFHGPTPPDEPPAPPAALASADIPQRFHAEVMVIPEWISVAYMSPRSRAAVQSQMEKDSEVSLRDFLTPEKYRAVLESLDDPGIGWERAGPANQRRYSRATSDQLAGTAAGALLRVLSSSAFARVLQDCTDLPLTAHCRLEVQRWQAGDFTLLPPRSEYQAARLEAMLHLGAPTRTLSGGSTCYVAPEDAEGGSGSALVTVPPISNALSLVYCDAGAAGFTKYLSKMTMPEGERFYIVTCTYHE